MFSAFLEYRCSLLPSISTTHPGHGDRSAKKELTRRFWLGLKSRCGTIFHSTRTIAALAALVVTSFPASSQELRVVSADTSIPGNVSVTVENPDAAASQSQNYSLRFDEKNTIKASDSKLVAPTGRSTFLVICVDKSGSMGNATLEAIKTTLENFVERSHPALDVAIVGFGSATKSLAGFGTDPQVIGERIRELTVESRDSKTKLYEAVSSALDQLKSRGAGGVKRLLVISDGKDEGSDTALERIVEKAGANGLSIDAIGAGRLAPRYSSSLESMADRTGGHFLLSRPGETGIAEAFDELVRQFPPPKNSVLVTFKYNVAADEPKTDHAVIEYSRSGAQPLHQNIPGVLAVPAKASNPNSWEQLFIKFKIPIIAIASALLAGAILLWLIALMRKKRPPQSPPQPQPVSPGAKVVTPPLSEVKRPAERATKFARYSFPPPRPGQPAAVLKGVNGPVGGRQVPIEKEIFRIGADANNNELSLAGDDFVSSNHATIKYDSGSLYLADRQSRNGTFLNGARLAQVPMPLSLGDEIRVGKSTMVLEIGSEVRTGASPDEGSVA